MYLDGLETTLKSCILFQVLAVFIQRGGTDGLQLTASQHGLENGCCINRAFSRASTHEGVQFVDKQNDVSTSANFLQHLLQALFEVSAVTAASHQSTKVQRVEVLVLQCLGYFALNDGLGQSFNDGGLADAGLTDEDGVVLGTTREHLHHALDFLFPANHWVQLAFAGSLGEVAPELIQDQRCRRRAFGWATGGSWFLALVPRQQLNDLLADTVEVRAELDQHLCCYAIAFTNQSQEDVLGADVVVAKLQGFTQRQFKNFLRTRSKWNVSARSLLALTNDLLNLAAHSLKRNAQRLQ